jgi:drug/metabolite transporter (DMT)-like permease
MREVTRRGTIAGFAYVVLATVLWSLVPICVKKCSLAFDAYSITWIRFAVGSLFLLVVSYTRGGLSRLRRRDAGLIVLAGTAIGINYTAYIRGLQLTTASAGNVVVNFEAIWLVVLSYFWLKERVTGVKLVGALITFAGVFAAIWNGEGFASLVNSDYFIGNMLIIGAAPLWAVYGIGQKLLGDRGVSISASLACIFGVAAIVTFPAVLLGFHVHQPVDISVWFWLFVLVILGTVAGYLMMAKGFEHLDASTAAVVTCTLPILTIIAARIFLAETLSTEVAVGAVLVVVGMVITGHAGANSTIAQP